MRSGIGLDVTHALPAFPLCSALSTSDFLQIIRGFLHGRYGRYTGRERREIASERVKPVLEERGDVHGSRTNGFDSIRGWLRFLRLDIAKYYVTPRLDHGRSEWIATQLEAEGRWVETSRIQDGILGQSGWRAVGAALPATERPMSNAECWHPAVETQARETPEVPSAWQDDRPDPLEGRETRPLPTDLTLGERAVLRSFVCKTCANPHENGRLSLFFFKSQLDPEIRLGPTG